ncbi:WYL domain-containing protein [Arsenicicoccus piscis]|nr:WYL domain-containing protein [Arsenicicoccus piscis]MCH8628395.1 WYL domain-containing protein [Arsenicicoccus piscis]MCH8629310.1 WYL domain-containing protein [Arsenicicoccus piscis]
MTLPGINLNEPATDRLHRLLAMVPWLLNRQGVDLEQAAASFGVSTEQLEADLQLLFLCGTPGGLPDDLIDASWEEGRVYLSNADTIARPLRLGVDEALTLIVGLRALAAVPGLGDRDAVDRAIAKLEAAAGSLPGALSDARAVTVDLADQGEVPHLSEVRAALEDHRRLHLRYVVPSRDETTERDVDPMRVVSIDGPWYLEGWCHRAQDVRLFRLDRIEALSVLDEDGTPPAQARPRDLGNGLFQPGADDLRVSIDVAPEAAWVVDYYPTESVEERPGDVSRVTLAVADRAWLRRLLLRLGAGAQVVEPAEVAADVAGAASAALALYEES